MVFGLFTRKSILDNTPAPPESKAYDHHNRPPTPTPSIASVAHRSPHHSSTAIRAVLGGSADSTLKGSLATESVAEGGINVHSPAPPPPDTPTPPPVCPSETKALYDLMLTIPPKTLHAYTLAHLRPQLPLPSAPTSSSLGLLPNSNTPRPPSPNMVNKLTSFFSTLAPPPLLHCVRCHKDFYEVENEGKDKACHVPHDDESALVSRISGGGGGYETLWSCCGQTASGDGSEGPPDGWCYEGRHTIDIRRARFRADSTMHDDKLTSCLKLNCHGIRDRLPRRDSITSPSRNAGASSARRSNPSPVRSQASRSTRKRPRKSLKGASGSENEGDAESSVGRAAKASHKEKAGGGAGEKDKDTSMAVDEPTPSKPRVKAKSRPISQARPPASTSMIVSLPTPVSKARTTPAKPKSTSRTLISQSHTLLASDSEATTRSRPRTRSHVRDESRARDASRNRTTSKLTRASISERTKRTRKAAKPSSDAPSSEEEQEAETDEYRESGQEGRGRDRKKRRLGRD
ncbi:hypothetical protein L210DRAFT_3507292 [Boletus edulis BED1]|uniref:Uncharacterized protein n=1 Tax=Boletus edulis BED1 TaxID=1328754 RepID=A0AAD4BJT3_BOLED|nr:hypothetical protein L210DRAFT_3507292 [Boletus edulis BED1]